MIRPGQGMFTVICWELSYSGDWDDFDPGCCHQLQAFLQIIIHGTRVFFIEVYSIFLQSVDIVLVFQPFIQRVDVPFAK